MIMPYISIIILNYNGSEDTIECLESLKKQTYKNFEIILIDNASIIDEFDKLKKYVDNSNLNIQLMQLEKNMGFTGGNNIGVKYSKSEYLCFLNNDTVVDKNWLKELIVPFLKYKNLGAVTCMIKKYYNPNEVENGGKSSMNIFGQIQSSKNEEDEIGETLLVSGTCFMIKRDVIEKLCELFCSQYFIYFEEIDLSWRLYNLKYKMFYNPRAIIYHKARRVKRKIKKPIKCSILEVRNKFLTFYRNLPLNKFLLILPFLLCFEFLKRIALLFREKDFREIKAMLIGIYEFIKMRNDVPCIRNGHISFLEKKIYFKNYIIDIMS